MSLDVAVQEPLVRSLIVAPLAEVLGLVNGVDALVLAMPRQRSVNRVGLAASLANVRLVATAILAVVLPRRCVVLPYQPVVPGWQICKN